MLKKIYSLAASLLIVSACTTDELVPVDNPDNKSEITLSFNVDVPTAEVISKASSALDGEGQEIGVEDLYLYAYDASGAFIEKAKAKMVTTEAGATSYQAIISKDTRKIHFLSNCGVNGLDASLVQNFNNMYTYSSNQYAFWGVKDYGTSDLPSQLGAIDLYRNWAKLDVQFTEDGTAKDKLYNVSYMIYNESLTNTLAAPVDREINLPAGLDWSKPASYTPTAFGTSSYIFENNNQISSGTFLIIEASYNSPSAPLSYYKIDLSKMEDEGYVKVYNVIRNHHFIVNIKDVAISGVATYAEAIADGKPADNNITASAELNDYPKITYDGETLIVTKTTWVFTEGGQSLNMQADYTIGSTPSNSLLKYVAGAGIPTVTNGGVTLHGNGNITANINNPSSTEQRGYFYITGGKLQRMITLVLRQPYQFKAFSLTDASVDANSGVTAHFELPSDIEKAIFPLEFKFTSKKLYATESGVRISTDGKGNYVYVYTAQSYQAGGYNVTFKTNSPNLSGIVETVALNAEYFATAIADLKAIGNSPAINSATFTGTYNYLGGTATLAFTTPTGIGQAYDVDITLPTGVTGATTYTVQPGVTSHSIPYTTSGATITAAAFKQGTITISVDGSSKNATVSMTGSTVNRNARLSNGSNRITNDITSSNFTNLGNTNVARITSRAGGSSDRYYVIAIAADVTLSSTTTFTYSNKTITPSVNDIISKSTTGTPGSAQTIAF